MADVFISYSHEKSNYDFVANRLVPTLEGHGTTVWVDKKGIRPTTEWLNEIYENILRCNNFVFVISPHCVRSEWCQLEVAYARKQNKRLVPIVFQRIDDEETTLQSLKKDHELEALAREALGEHSLHMLARDNWLALKRLQWIFFNEGAFDQRIEELEYWIKADIAYVDRHTQLQEAANHWKASARDLLHGRDLRNAERWLSISSDKEPRPTILQVQYIAASRRAATVRRRLALGTVVIGMTVLLMLLLVAFTQMQFRLEQQALAQSRSLAAQSEVALENEQLPLAYQLAIEAFETSPTLESERALYRVVARPLPLLIVESGLYAASEGGTMASFNPDGTRIVTIGRATAQIWDAGTGEEQVALSGHTDLINSAVFSPDGTKVLTSSYDGTARLWDANTGEAIVVLGTRTSSVYLASFSPDGSKVLTASSNDALRIWDSTTGEELNTLDGTTNGVSTIHFSPDGTRIIATQVEDRAQLWDAMTGAKLAALGDGEERIWTANFSPDGRRVITGGTFGTVQVWDATTGDAILALEGHTDLVTISSFSPDGSKVLTASIDGTVRLWDVSQAFPYGTILGNNIGVVNFALFSPNGNQILTVGQEPKLGGPNGPGDGDGKVRLWAIDEFGRVAEQAVLENYTSRTKAASFSMDGTLLLIGHDDGMVRVWDTRSRPPLFSVGNFTGAMSPVRFSPDGGQILMPGPLIWDVEADTELLSLQIGMTHTGNFSPDGTRIIASSTLWEENLPQENAMVFDTTTGALQFNLGGHHSSIWLANFSPDGSYIVTGSFDGALRLWDANTGTLLSLLDDAVEPYAEPSFSPDGELLAVVGNDHIVRVRDLRSWQQISSLRGHTEKVAFVSFSPDGSRILTVSYDHTARIWDAERGNELVVFRGHSGGIEVGAFSPTGTQVVTGAGDNTARLWDSETGAETALLVGHTNAVTSVSFSPDGRRILTGSVDHTARIWDIQTGAEITTLQGLDGPLLTAVFNAAGTRILTTTQNGQVWLWPSSGNELLRIAEERLSRLRTSLLG